MLFNSFEFIVFLPAVLVAAWLTRGRARTWVLLAASYVFYMFWSIPLASLLLLSSVVDFYVGRALHATEAPRRRKALVLLSLTVNLGLLVFFKYTNFLLEAGTDILALFGVQRTAPHLDIILPLGISFYTFQTLSYTIDVYRRKLTPCQSLTQFSLYVSFFPQLVAGPIVRASEFLPQLERGPRTNADSRREGWTLTAIGFLKKMVLADGIAPFVNEVYGAPSLYSGDILLLATYGFAFQIYFDFSGYTDIARGLARLLGYELPLNFNKPYFSQSITEFWRRWHMSLSSWLRDYLYISLGGNRGGRFKTYRNLMLTMVLGGIWHGAAWTFIVWGLIHGGVLALERALPQKTPFVGDSAAAKVARMVWTFHLVCISWIFFRAASVTDAWVILEGIATRAWLFDVPLAGLIAAGLMAISLVFLAADVGNRIYERVLTVRGVPAATFYWLSAFIVTGFGAWTHAEFIYFQF